jgi:imidazolonepropionase-like amidohydrolase
VIAEGALADLILVDGDPVADISVIARPDEAFTAIIKDGRLVKGADHRMLGAPAWHGTR